LQKPNRGTTHHGDTQSQITDKHKNKVKGKYYVCDLTEPSKRKLAKQQKKKTAKSKSSSRRKTGD